jgi:hypothetical protein
MDPTIAAVIDQLRQELPAVFAGSNSGELTGGAIHWPTVQNKRSKGEIPDDCFVRSGRRVLVHRDRFLDWWAMTLSEARQSPRTNRPRPQAVRARRNNSTSDTSGAAA